MSLGEAWRAVSGTNGRLGYIIRPWTWNLRLTGSQPQGSSPQHIVLVADPQLVDPHTYPGRPWPLSALTIRHTDLYMRKSFNLIQDALNPDTILFLGDLFDGGREWATSRSKSPEKRWKRYGEDFWLREYDRFGRIFLDKWSKGQTYKGRTDRKLQADLPGNHDLGLGNGIQLPVRERFNAYFGESNRIEIIGNHSFISVDTVSLSAKGQADPTTGSQGAGDGVHPNPDIWGPAENFLSQARSLKARVIESELRVRNGMPETDRRLHAVRSLNELPVSNAPQAEKRASSIPSVLLTHVPLYRAPDTPCGPLRESAYNSIRVQFGYQYQNVLTQELSRELIDKVGDVGHVFSGDDHDYCELVHMGYTSNNGGVHEITVKSISWAMGVRKPGFVLLSLWNPINSKGVSIPSNSDQGSTSTTARPRTLQSHLCLLPDQLSIFIRYGILLGVSIIFLIFHAIKQAAHQREVDSNDPLLPLVESQNANSKSGKGTTFTKTPAPTESGSTSSNSTMSQNHEGLAARSMTGRTKSRSPSTGYAAPAYSSLQSFPGDRFDIFGNSDGFDKKALTEIILRDERKKKPRKYIFAVWHEFRKSFVRVGLISMVWYGWLGWIS